MQEYGYISSKRIACFYSSKLQPHQFTLLVRGIPVPPGSTCSEIVERFFLEYHPSTYLSHSVIRRSSKLQNLIVSIFLELQLTPSCPLTVGCIVNCSLVSLFISGKVYLLNSYICQLWNID